MGDVQPAVEPFGFLQDNDFSPTVTVRPGETARQAKERAGGRRRPVPILGEDGKALRCQMSEVVVDKQCWTTATVWWSRAPYPRLALCEDHAPHIDPLMDDMEHEAKWNADEAAHAADRERRNADHKARVEAWHARQDRQDMDRQQRPEHLREYPRTEGRPDRKAKRSEYRKAKYARLRAQGMTPDEARRKM